MTTPASEGEWEDVGNPANPVGQSQWEDAGTGANVKEFNSKPLKAHFDENFAKGVPQEASRATAEAPTPPKKAETFLEALDAGFQTSVTGLLKRQKAPDIFTSPDSGMFYRIASQMGSLAGDIPAMIVGGIAGRFVGGVAGAAAGSPFPGGGNAVGGAIGSTLGEGVGAFALPAAMRKIMMDHYEKGDIKSAGEFWERASATFLEASKAGLVGGATVGVGGIVGKVVAPGVTGVTGAALKASSEIATMVTLGKAVEGQLPEPMDFVDGAIMVGGLHMAGAVSGKMRSVYADHGVLPSEAAIESATNPLVKQELLSKNPDNAVIAEQVNGEKPPVSEISQTNPEEIASVSKLPEEAPPAEGEAPEVAEARAKIRSQIGEVTPEKGNKYSFRQFYTDFVDKLDPIKQAVEQMGVNSRNTSDAENPYSLARMTNDYKAKVVHVVEKGTIDFKTLAVNGEGFNEVIAPHAKDLKAFEAYMISERAVEKSGQGIESDPDLLAAAKTVIKADKNKYREAASNLVDFSNRVLKYFYDSGGLTKEAYEKFLELNQKYIPYSRIFENDDGGYGKTGKPSSLKTLTAGLQEGLKMQSPLQSVLENTQALMRAAEKNRAVGKLIDVIEATPDQTLFEKVKADTKVTEISAKDMQKYADKIGLEGEAEALTVFRKQTKYTLSDNEFSADRDGKKQVWSTAPEVAKAIKSLDGDPGSTSILFKIANRLTAIKKVGITFTPDFIIKNFLRDQLTKQAFSESGGMPVWDTVLAMKDIIGKNDTYYNWLKAGGAGGSFIDMTDVMNKNLFSLNKETGFMDKVWNAVKTPADFLKVSGSIIEEATRLSEFKRVSKGSSEGPDVFEGGFASREVTVDFQRIGARMSALNAITAFQNVNIQGLDRTVRAGMEAYKDIKENPASAAIHPFVLGTGLITTISALLWYSHHDEDWYKAVPNWEKDTFWHLKAGGTIWRFPKPQELGLLFGSLPERVLGAFFTDNPRAFKDFAGTMSGVLTPSFIPDAVSTPLEQMMNRSLFTGSPVVSQSAEKLLPPYQYTDYTTESAKAIAKVIGYIPGVADIGPKDAKLSSPMVVENYVKGWSGSLGMYALELGEKAMVKSGVVPDLKPESTLADIPFIKAFVSRYPRATAQPIVDFRDRYQDTEKIYATAKMLGQQGNFNEMQKVLAIGDSNMIRLKETNDAITNIGHAIRLTYQNPAMDKHEKRQLIDTMYFQMIQAAQSGNDLVDGIDRQMKEKKGK